MDYNKKYLKYKSKYLQIASGSNAKDYNEKFPNILIKIPIYNNYGDPEFDITLAKEESKFYKTQNVKKVINQKFKDNERFFNNNVW